MTRSLRWHGATCLPPACAGQPLRQHACAEHSQARPAITALRIFLSLYSIQFQATSAAIPPFWKWIMLPAHPLNRWREPEDDLQSSGFVGPSHGFTVSGSVFITPATRELARTSTIRAVTRYQFSGSLPNMTRLP
jgi:hypothetical protein